ncbi:MAG TPA: PEP-CTERM sorting domain-containing protein [Acidobacteriota bacterium]|nr:PEP-CTERM sorting domain-containing protein [Acidobacteriota bacterium]
MKITIRHLGACLALLPLAALAQNTVFHTTFGSDSLNQAAYTPTSSSTNWDIASSKNSTSTSLTGSGLNLTLPSTSSGYVEAQTTFSNSGVTLSTVGDYITVKTVFTANSNILAGISGGSWLAIGLYDSNGSKPLNTLNNSALTTGNATYASGGTVGWEGYSAVIRADNAVGNSAGSSAVTFRPAQTTGTLTSAAQALSYSGSGGYFYPAGTNLNTSNTDAATGDALTNGNTYTLTYNILLSAANTYTISTNLYDGNGTTGTNLATISGTAAGATFLTGPFDGLMIGYRYSNTSATSNLTLTDVLITSNVASAVPEPSTYAALVGLAALGFVGWRRRRTA